MVYLMWGLVMMVGLVCATVLVINGFPWFAFFVLVVLGCIEIKHRSGED